MKVEDKAWIIRRKVFGVLFVRHSYLPTNSAQHQPNAAA